MNRLLHLLFIPILASPAFSQTMTAETLWELGRVGYLGITKDGKSVVYNVSKYNIKENKSASQKFLIPLEGGNPKKLEEIGDLVPDKAVSPDGKMKLITRPVKIEKVYGSDHYPDLGKSEAMIYDDLNYRHWDAWEDGEYSHLIVVKENNEEIDLLENMPFDCPQQPFGGDEDYTWSPDGKEVVYVTKKKKGREYTISTNTDIYSYDLASGNTTNLSNGMMGYDTEPHFSKNGRLAWLSMKRDGYESDKNDIVVLYNNGVRNLTKDWDGSVRQFIWSNDGKSIYFTAPVGGTIQIFTMTVPSGDKGKMEIKQLTKGDFDVRGVFGQSGNTLVALRSDMNHASELYTVSLKDGSMKQLSHVNDEAYSGLKMSKVERRYMTTKDNQKMLTWVIYPPDFDPSKKYPTLLYCQGGPQSPLSQFYSFRWNFQLMAANGYIIVAPNRRGMPGHGVKWNEDISKNYGGLAMQDYLTAIDEMAKEPFVDNERLGCIGASFGGYSAFYLAGIHEKRFKTFISHDGIFNWRSMYGTTEEMWFVDWDLGGPYWKKDEVTQRSYGEYNPISLVEKWDTPILIIQGGKDFRVPIGQGLEAFQAAQLQGIKSRLLYLPNENHWVLSAQNGIVWQNEFFRWLKETL